MILILFVLISALSSLALYRNRFKHIGLKIAFSTLLFISTFYLLTSFVLKQKDFTFRKYLWERWACFDVHAENDNFLSVRFPENLGFVGREYEIKCKNPIEYDVKLNKFGTRSTPEDPLDWSNIDIALLGDSYIWGTGLTDNETMAYVLQKQKKKRIVVNLGVPGGGPSSALRFLELAAQKKIPVGRVNDVIYIIRDGVYVRNTGKGRWLYHPRNSKYIFRDGRPQYIGTFNSIHDIDYSSLNPFRVVNAFIYGMYHLYSSSEVPDDADVIFTAKILNAMNWINKNQLKSNFYLYNWPESSKDGKIEARRNLLLNNLDKSISVFEIKEKLNLMINGKHPDKEAAEKMALIINRNLIKGDRR